MPSGIYLYMHINISVYSCVRVHVPEHVYNWGFLFVEFIFFVQFAFIYACRLNLLPTLQCGISLGLNFLMGEIKRCLERGYWKDLPR